MNFPNILVGIAYTSLVIGAIASGVGGAGPQQTVTVITQMKNSNILSPDLPLWGGGMGIARGSWGPRTPNPKFEKFYASMK